jgi:hypothetical protein
MFHFFFLNIQFLKTYFDAQDSKLGKVDNDIFSGYKENHKKGTIIYFEDIQDGIKNRLEYI